ncbi:TetR/AcrR family transcriptional regulator [Haloechinothrix salitolerans]|uniref:TetR/AcrR family transcriptional regulator n=1 Tax=Haloechinothrix salitolerans TaxID=926830 RepID=A0ABW2BU65_9PSEU
MLDAESSEEPQRRSDGEQTHTVILEAAMRLASIEGLGSLTVGRLARELDISKSGVFAHFRSKERLQRETIDAAQAVFDREVVRPGLAAPAGLAQVENLCEAYLRYVERRVFPGGCFFAQLLAEYDAPAGAIHDAVAEGQRGWLGLLEGLITTAKDQGELHPAIDATQLAFELYAALELANYLFILYSDPAMTDRGRHAIRTAIARSTP